MAIVKYSPLIAEARGAVGDIVFSRNTYGAYVRDRVIPVNPNSPQQQSVRGIFATVTAAWQNLTDDQRREWEAHAKAESRYNIYNDNSPLSGYNLYVKTNQWRLLMGAPLLAKIGNFSPPNNLIISSFVANTTAGTIVVNFTPNGTPTKRNLIYATPGLSPGINFVKSEFRLVAHSVNARTSPVTFTARYIAIFGALPAVGTKVFIMMRNVVIGNGLSSVPQIRSNIAI